MHRMSDEYLAEELEQEYAEKKCRISAVKAPDTVQSAFAGECMNLNKKLITLQA